MKNKRFDDNGFQVMSTHDKIVAAAIGIIGTVLWFTIIILMLDAMD